MAGEATLVVVSPPPIVIRVVIAFFLSLLTWGSHFELVTFPKTRMLSVSFLLAGSLMLGALLLGEFCRVLISPMKSELPLLNRLF